MALTSGTMCVVDETPPEAGLLDIPGGIFHWRAVFEALAWQPTEHLYEELGLPPSPSLRERARQAQETIDRDLASSGESLSPEEFRSVSTKALAKALDLLPPGERNAVVALGGGPERRGAQAFMWSVIVTRLLREPDRARVAIPDARWQELARWSEEERRWEEALKRSAEGAGDEEEVRERLESAVLDLLRQAAFDRLMPQITRWPDEEKRLLYQLAREEGTRMGVDDDRYL